MEQPHDVSQTEEYEDWLEQQSLKTQVIVSKRIKNIIDYGHFGDSKNVSKYDKGITKDRIFELRWDDGKRVYYGKIDTLYLILLYGGNKNGQDKDIQEAKSIFIKYIEVGKSTDAQKKGKSKKI